MSYKFLFRGQSLVACVFLMICMGFSLDCKSNTFVVENVEKEKSINKKTRQNLPVKNHPKITTTHIFT